MSALTLVTGITGQQGGAVARSLLSTGHRVRGYVRDPGSDKAKALAGQGVELAKGDLTDPVALLAAMRGVDTVFAMTTPFEAGPESEVTQGRAMIEAATQAGVSHFVYNSVASADQATGIPHFDSKFEVEQELAASELTWTVVAPVYFMENLLFPQTVEGLEGGVYAIPMPSDTKLQQIPVQDIGNFSAHVIRNRDAFAGKRIDIASDELSAAETATKLASTLNKPLTTVEVPIEQIRSFSEDLAVMYEWFVTTGYSADIEALRREHPDVGWRRFDEWAGQAVPDSLS